MLVEEISEFRGQLAHLLEILARRAPQMLNYLRCTKRLLTMLDGKSTKSSVGFARHEVEQIDAIDGAISRFKRHLQSFHQLYAMFKFNELPSLLRLIAD